MIQRDYILRMIEELRRILAGIVALKEERRWQEVEGTLEEQFRRLVGAGASEAVGLSETELSARLIQGEATQFVRDKTIFLIRLFKEAGDAAVAQDRPDEGRAFYVKGLHLLLGVLGEHDTPEHPDYVPPVEIFTAALTDAHLPTRTQAMLMHHYERTGAFAKAEDALFALLHSVPRIPELLDFGISFYERVRGQSDAALEAGNLPRHELESGLAELQQRKAEVSS
jgi:hypothetical protein